MDAKLIKENNYYYLKHDDKIIGTIDAHPLSSINVMQLSLKNCQAIANGYDLDELAENEVRYMRRGDERLQRWYGFVDGFEKALEILGDKKFSEDDVRKAFVDAFQKCYEVINSGKFDDITSAIEWLTQTNADNYIQSLKQTEWDVWLVMACGLPDGCTEPEVTCTCDIIPSLDTDGCIILKRK